jgi:Uma2 family endonuclease
MATVTPEQIEDLSGLSQPDALYEVVGGRIVEKTVGAYECWLVAVLLEALATYLKSNQLGRAVPEMIFDLRPTLDRERRPDVAFVSFARWASDRRVPQTRSWAVAPDLAVEIVSPSNTADEVAEKLEEYFKAGVRLVWVVYPRQMKVYAYNSPTDIRVFALGDKLEGGDVLPGFQMALENLFEQSSEPG